MSNEVRTLTEQEKALRERLSSEDWMIVKAGFRRSYSDALTDAERLLERARTEHWQKHLREHPLAERSSCPRDYGIHDAYAAAVNAVRGLRFRRGWIVVDLHHGDVPAFDPALVDLLTRTIEQEYDAANAAGGEWGPCYPAPRTLAVALAQALGVAGVRNLVRSSTSGDGLHHCARCGIELDSDDRDDLCEECHHLVFPPDHVREEKADD